MYANEQGGLLHTLLPKTDTTHALVNCITQVFPEKTEADLPTLLLKNQVFWYTIVRSVF